MLKRLLRHPAPQAALAYLLGLYLWLTLRTTRWRFEGTEHLARFAASEAPAIITFWHERLPMMPTLWLLERSLPGANSRAREAHVLVSQHRDGKFIAAVIKRFSLSVVLGSSSRGGATGFRVLAGLLARGHYVAIAPDGPRGPARQAAPGVAKIAALSDSPVLPCAAQTSRRWVLNTWDRMIVPRPFGRGVLVCGPPIRVTRGDWQKILPAIAAALDATADRADLLCAT
jgi:lysophospholipid acyltransferase (LPLAT)-like uncharacterized protein